MNWPTSKYYRIVATVLTNLGAASGVRPDLTATDRSGGLCPLRAVDFDPMESRTW